MRGLIFILLTMASVNLIASTRSDRIVLKPGGPQHNHYNIPIPADQPDVYYKLELQNVSLTNSQYIVASDVTCGKQVNTGRSFGDVIVKDGVEYEIEASGTVTLEDGFKVEKGATFAVYPSCF